jgi:hypothetical protein
MRCAEDSFNWVPRDLAQRIAEQCAAGPCSALFHETDFGQHLADARLFFLEE